VEKPHWTSTHTRTEILPPRPVFSTPNSICSHITSRQDLVRGADFPYPELDHTIFDRRRKVFSLERDNLRGNCYGPVCTEKRRWMGLDRCGRQMQDTPLQIIHTRDTARNRHCGMAPTMECMCSSAQPTKCHRIPDSHGIYTQLCNRHGRHPTPQARRIAHQLPQTSTNRRSHNVDNFH
jgi:hypothetical protein